MTDQLPEVTLTPERIGLLIDYWTAKSKSHERWPEGQGMHADALGRIYADTIAALQVLAESRASTPPVASLKQSDRNTLIDALHWLARVEKTGDNRINYQLTMKRLTEIAQRLSETTPALPPGDVLTKAAENLLDVLDAALVGAPDTGLGVRPENYLPVMAHIEALRNALTTGDGQ